MQYKNEEIKLKVEETKNLQAKKLGSKRRREELFQQDFRKNVAKAMKDEDVRDGLLVAMEASEARLKPEMVQNDKVLSNMVISNP